MLNFLAYYLHDFDPIIFSLGPIKARWYGFAYLLGFLAAYMLIRKLARVGMLRLPLERVSDLVLNCCIFGVLLGGRFGYVLFYDLPNKLRFHETPLLWDFSSSLPFWGVLRVTEGGMSAHGGVIFTILTLIWFARKYRSRGASLVNIGDAACMVVPIGLCFGRIANFINGELYGHITRVPWAVKFPSELYSPTNGANEIAEPQVAQMQSAVGHYLGEHWQNLTTQQLQDFLANHPTISHNLTEQFGHLTLKNAQQLDAVKQWLGTELCLNPNQIFSSDIARWWEHSSGAFHDLLRTQFDLILHPRHPSQLYEALLEGILLFLIVWLIGWFWRKEGMAGGAFLTFYPVMRIIGEQFRVGDSTGIIANIPISLGVAYSIPMMILGLTYWAYWIRRNRKTVWVPPPASS
ncbi:MAG: prolipoprotein diacylglyceryl transferase [Phycisphaerales bacterium]|nr:prolipoprotein diacylglyceryl transferase [Phycisphaerales bacterium]